MHAWRSRSIFVCSTARTPLEPPCKWINETGKFPTPSVHFTARLRAWSLGIAARAAPHGVRGAAGERDCPRFCMQYLYDWILRTDSKSAPACTASWMGGCCRGQILAPARVGTAMVGKARLHPHLWCIRQLKLHP